MLNSDSTFDQVVVLIDGLQNRTASYLSVRNTDGATHSERRVHVISPTDEENGVWDYDDGSFEELDARAERGEIEILYELNFTRSSKLYTFDEIKDEWTDDVKRQNPLLHHQQTTEGMADDGPHDTIYYRRSSTELSTRPDVEAYDAINNTVDEIMEDVSWTRTIPTGTDTLYHVTVTWGVADETPFAHSTLPATEEIRWSVDGGVTFSTTEPTDSDTVHAIEVYIAGQGWVETSIAEEDPAPGNASPFVWISGEVFQNGGNGSDTYQQRIAIPQSLRADNYRFGIMAREPVSWSDLGNNIRMGFAEIPITELEWCYPHEYGSRDSQNRVARRTYCLEQYKPTGRASLHLCDSSSRDITDWSGDYAVMFVVFTAYPKTTLTETISAGNPQLWVEHRDDIAAGDILYVGDEQIRVTTVGDYDGLNDGYRITITRGVNGTTAVRHDEDDSVRAVVNKDAMRHMIITNRRGVADKSIVRLYRIRNNYRPDSE